MSQSEVAQLRTLLTQQIKARGLFYLAVHRAMADRFGSAAADEVMRAAIYQRGLAASERFKAYAPDDFAGLRDAFLDFVPDGAHTFRPEVVRCDDEGLDIHLQNCPMRDSWQEAGISGDEVGTLCELAGVVDKGTFEGAGFTIDNETWRPGREGGGCCRLHIRRKTQPSADVLP